MYKRNEYLDEEYKYFLAHHPEGTDKDFEDYLKDYDRVKEEFYE